jgi:DNA-binding MarR family transcriptional regulator
LSQTAAGQAAYDDLFEVAKAYDARLTADLTTAERETLKGLLVKLAAGQGGDI